MQSANHENLYSMYAMLLDVKQHLPCWTTLFPKDLKGLIVPLFLSPSFSASQKLSKTFHCEKNRQAEYNWFQRCSYRFNHWQKRFEKKPQKDAGSARDSTQTIVSLQTTLQNTEDIEAILCFCIILCCYVNDVYDLICKHRLEEPLQLSTNDHKNNYLLILYSQ